HEPTISSLTSLLAAEDSEADAVAQARIGMPTGGTAVLSGALGSWRDLGEAPLELHTTVRPSAPPSARQRRLQVRPGVQQGGTLEDHVGHLPQRRLGAEGDPGPGGGEHLAVVRAVAHGDDPRGRDAVAPRQLLEGAPLHAAVDD